MHKSAEIFLGKTNNNKPDIAVILGSGLTNFFDDGLVIEEKVSTIFPFLLIIFSSCIHFIPIDKNIQLIPPF